MELEKEKNGQKKPKKYVGKGMIIGMVTDLSSERELRNVSKQINNEIC